MEDDKFRKLTSGLMGMGAWFAGNGPQYQQVQLAQEEQQRKARDMANLDDTRRMIAAGSRGDFNSPMQLLENRVENLKAKGGNWQHSEQSLALLKSNPSEWLRDQMIGEKTMSDALKVDSMFAGAGQQVGWDNVKTGADGLLYGIDKSNPSAGVQRIPSPEGVNFAAPKEPKDNQSQVNTLRKDIYSLGKEFRDVERSYGKLTGALKSGTAPGDLSAIFAYMKMIDPGSTVREGEMATAKNAAGIPERIMNMYNNARRGVMLNDTQRAEFAAEAQSMFDVERGAYDRNIYNVLQQADADGISRELVLGKERLKAFDERLAAAEEAKDKGGDKKLPPTNAKGWRLATDAAGNRAYVGPNGEIEEV